MFAIVVGISCWLHICNLLLRQWIRIFTQQKVIRHSHSIIVNIIGIVIVNILIITIVAFVSIVGKLILMV